ncbi:HAD family phosphatase [Glaciihabitans arcticus]|uniref:HAD family phosphatase n=2 Tax=Glaciihabitans arcticus TaxID=2668039 RepID=A0A4V2JF82_9MICO|nr:HAD family phosphatase [Glaciihabitans arcticus]
MDGTIVDTEPYWMDAEIALVESFGGTWTHEDALTVVGQGLWHTARVMRSRGVVLTDDEIIEALTARVMEQVREHVPWRPGARDLLDALKHAGVKTALVTMSMRSLAELVVEAIRADGLDTPFEVVVSGDDVEHAKPHPEPYLTAAALLGVDIADCIAIEDSEPGLASAIASGAVSIGVPHMVPLSSAPTHHLWPSLDGRTVADLATAFESELTR